MGSLVRVRLYDVSGNQHEEKGIVLQSSGNVGEQLMIFPAVRIYLIESGCTKIIFMNEVIEILSRR